MRLKYKLLLLLAIITGCSLEEKIYDSAIAETFIRTENDVLAVLGGVYSYLPSYSSYKANLTYQILYGGDDVATTAVTPRLFTERTVPSSNVYFVSPWTSYYQTINCANALLKTLETSEAVSESFRTRIMGELYFMRAFCYFNLVRLHGGVPIKTEATDGDSDFYPVRNSVEEVYTLVFEDLVKASADCIPFSEQPAGEFGHATKGAAQTILSLAYLTYANNKDLAGQNSEARPYYQLAENYADSVLLSNEYSLVSNYADLFDVNKERSAYQEVIFAIQHTRDATAASTSGKGGELAYFTQPTTRYYICGNVINGQGAGQLRIHPWFYDLCSTGDYTNDYRTEVSFLTRFRYQDTQAERITYPEVRKAAETTEQYPYLNKYVDPDGYQARNNENDFYIIRLSEVYLIKAEAENELNGPTDQAYAAFNQLRARARLANGTARTTPPDLQPGLTKEQFRLKIFDERGLELVGEGHRWFDAIRMRYLDNQRPMIQYRYEDFYPSMAKTAPSYSVSTNTWGGGRVLPTSVVAWTPKFLIWAIPSSEIDANPNMTQNPGW
ncbi:MAG: RagB/SusD family nutrient uptake outer membrane protein [Mangrovibacterium sp.]